MLTEEKCDHPGNPLVVTEADRAATAAFLQKVFLMDWMTLRRILREVEDNRPDEYGLLHIIARHRLMTDRTARVEGARLALDSAADIVHFAAGARGKSYLLPGVLPDIEAILRATSPEDLVLRGFAGVQPRGAGEYINRFA